MNFDTLYNFCKTFNYYSDTNLAVIPGGNTFQHIVTIEDAVVTGFYLISLSSNIRVWDTNGANPSYPLEPCTTAMHWDCFLQCDINLPFGDTAHTAEVPGTWLRDIFPFQPNRQYRFDPGAYMPGNVINISLGFMLDGNYVAVGNLLARVGYTIQIGFQTSPAGASQQTLRDESLFVEPSEMGAGYP